MLLYIGQLLSWVYNMTLAECCVSVGESSYCKQSLYTPASLTQLDAGIGFSSIPASASASAC